MTATSQNKSSPDSPAAQPASTPTAIEANPTGNLYRSLIATTAIAAAFCLLIFGLILFHRLTSTTNDPWKSPQLLALKERLILAPTDELLKQKIRQLDLQFRENFRRRLNLNRTAPWLLLAGLLAMTLASRQAAKLRTPLPSPTLPRHGAEQAIEAAKRARWAVVATTGIATILLAAISWTTVTELPDNLADVPRLFGKSDAPRSAPPDVPSFAEFEANWPRFRGPAGSGVVPTNRLTAPALALATANAFSVLWKSPVPSPGHNSPVIWGDHLFITGATAAKREVLCYDTATGQPLWTRTVEVPGGPAKMPDVPPDTGFACSTMATDGRRAYAIFANGDLVALHFDGAVAWSKYLGAPRNRYGYAASLCIWQGELMVQFDQGDNAQSGSKLIAVDGATGSILWERSRPVPASWATPIAIETAGHTQLVTLGVPWVIAYSLPDGAEQWRADLLEGEVTPSPVFANDLLLAVSPSSKLMALRPDGKGDVTKTHLAWTAEDNVPDVASPVSNGELVFTVTSDGIATCFDFKDGKKLWEHNLDLSVQASPSIVGARLLIVSTQGTVLTLAADRQFKQFGRTQIADKFLASPAFAHDQIFLRGMTNLYGLGPRDTNLAGGARVCDPQQVRSPPRVGMIPTRPSPRSGCGSQTRLPTLSNHAS